MTAHPARRQLTAKLANARRNYGEGAREYFIAQPACERCGEDRMACLAIHHRSGKRVDDLAVLCHNCHHVEHHGSYTLAEALDNRAPLGSGRNRSGTRHGTTWCYQLGCRCDDCRAAKADERVRARVA